MPELSSHRARLMLSRSIGHQYRVLRRAASAKLLAVLGPPLLRILSRTWRVEVLGADHLESVLAHQKGHFMALWHGRMIVGLAYHADTLGKRADIHALVSPSGDGNVSQALLTGFRYKIVRGSSRKRGAKAVREMLELLSRGSVIIITPDGPRGPRHSMSPGLIWMAKATGHPIIPCGFVCDHAWRARSWDRFTIPKPRARVVLVYGEPVEVARSATHAEVEVATQLVRERMMQAERRGFAHLNCAVDW